LAENWVKRGKNGLNNDIEFVEFRRLLECGFWPILGQICQKWPKNAHFLAVFGQKSLSAV
jgi:hypothetical protein